MRDDTRRLSVVVLFGTIVIIGALLFLPVAALGPVAEHSDRSRSAAEQTCRFEPAHDRSMMREMSDALSTQSGIESPEVSRTCSAATLSAAAAALGLFEPEFVASGAQAVIRHAAARHPVEEPGDVRGRDRAVLTLIFTFAGLGGLRQPGPLGYFIALDSGSC